MTAASRPWNPLAAVQSAALAARTAIAEPGPARRQFVGGVLALALFVTVVSLWMYISGNPGVDFEIPLRAAGRWSSGGQPYLASSFAETTGSTLPFLYPPWVLPLLAPVAALPRILVMPIWTVIVGAAAVWTCRRLSVPWPAVPLVMIWSPFLEGISSGNVQVIQMAAFAAMFYVPGANWRLTSRSAGRASARDAEAASDSPRTLRHDGLDGVLAAGVGVFKYTQLLTLVWLLRRRPRAAILGGLVLAALVVALLPITGIGVYWDWLAQLGRGADPNWALAGAPLSSVMGRPVAMVAAAIAVLAMFLVKGRDAGAWVGIALLVAAPSIHGYGMLFLLPALLILRRDLAIVLAIAVATYNPDLWWISIATAGVALGASYRFPALRNGPNRGAADDPRVAADDPRVNVRECLAGAAVD
ncbi:MAG TPA: glycosyltransferase 87 family protein [Candidatus Limnocylindrales bacterium]